MTPDNAKLSEAELEELLRAIARRHALNAVCPLGSQDEPDDAIVIQETIRAQEVIFYALKEAADDPRLLAMARGNGIASQWSGVSCANCGGVIQGGEHPPKTYRRRKLDSLNSTVYYTDPVCKECEIDP